MSDQFIHWLKGDKNIVSTVDRAPKEKIRREIERNRNRKKKRERDVSSGRRGKELKRKYICTMDGSA